MKKKVLFLSPLPPPYYGSAMSSEMCLKILKESKDFEVKNIKLNYSRDMSDLGRINLKKIKGIKIVKNQIKKEINEFNPDIIYFMPATDSLGAIRDYSFFKEIRKNTSKKIIFHIRARIQEKNWRNPIFNKIYKKMFTDRKSHYILLGEELISDFKGLIPKNKIFILPNAIKNEVTEKQLQRIRKQRQKNKKTNILFLSNMDKTKGWPKLLEACKILNEKGLDFRCNFVGSFTNEKDEREFHKFVKENNLENKVNYLGRKTGKEKNKILEKSHILVFPTEYKLETFGRVILEAMMFSIPVIANSIATIPSTVQEGKTGFLLKKNTPEEIAEKIEKLIKDENLREKMGRKGRERFLEEFELKNYKDKFLEILKSV